MHEISNKFLLYHCFCPSPMTFKLKKKNAVFVYEGGSVSLQFSTWGAHVPVTVRSTQWSWLCFSHSFPLCLSPPLCLSVLCFSSFCFFLSFLSFFSYVPSLSLSVFLWFHGFLYSQYVLIKCIHFYSLTLRISPLWPTGVPSCWLLCTFDIVPFVFDSYLIFGTKII